MNDWIIAVLSFEIMPLYYCEFILNLDIKSFLTLD